jgi:hypothetical protein
VIRDSSRFDDECYVADNFTDDINEPVNIQEAWTEDHSVEWKEATDSEYESLMKNDTWELVPPPKGKNIVGSRWVSKVKHTADGSVERFKVNEHNRDRCIGSPVGNKPVRGRPEYREKQRTCETCEREFCVKSESLFRLLNFTKT